MSPSKKAFYEWWADKKGGTPTRTEEECFQQGIEWAIRHGTQATRGKSQVRGRVVTALRIMTSEEIARENTSLDPKLVWPCLEMDDGSIVYAMKKVPDGQYGPALLGGQGLVDGATKRFTHTARVIDRQATARALDALQRGMVDGDRLQAGEVTPDQLVEELKDDPL